MLLVLLAELSLLYFFSRWVTMGLFDLFLLMFRTRSVATAFILILEFPGTVVHELSHLFTAEILGVHTGKLRLEPESIRGENITAGSVTIAESDPFRRYLIGLAPMFSGIIILTAISFFLPGLINSAFQQGIPFYQNPQFYVLLATGYLLFAASNTMFPSPQDLNGFLPFMIAIAVFVTALYFIGFRLVITGVILETETNILTTLVKSLGVVLGINAGLLILTKIITYLLTKIFRVIIVR